MMVFFSFEMENLIILITNTCLIEKTNKQSSFQRKSNYTRNCYFQSNRQIGPFTSYEAKTNIFSPLTKSMFKATAYKNTAMRRKRKNPELRMWDKNRIKWKSDTKPEKRNERSKKIVCGMNEQHKVYLETA